MPRDMTLDTRVDAIAGEPVGIPGGDFIANARMMRAGLDLHLTAPDGHSVVISGYFAQDPPPDLVSGDGARLSPQLVRAFLPPEHIGQYAASGQIVNDASPTGKVANVAGEAHIIRADGTHVAAAVGTLVYQGDVVETSRTGAVNILFMDNTAFAVSENARMTIDRYSYDSDHHSGSSFLSMLQGVFVYTSGLIGKNDPGNVSIETPVGTIGIRGTEIAGHLSNYTFTSLDGTSVFTNHGGTLELHRKFETAFIDKYNTAPQNIGLITPETFANEYQSLAEVAHDAFAPFNIPFGVIHQQQPPEHGMLKLPGDGSGLAWNHDNSTGPSGTPLPVYQTEQPVQVAENSIFFNPDGTYYTGIVPSGRINAMGGSDTLVLTSHAPAFFDFTASPLLATFTNFEAIDLGRAGGGLGNMAVLDVETVFRITDNRHILNVFADPHAAGSVLDVVESSAGTPGFDLFSSVDTGVTTTTIYTGVSPVGGTVTLVILSIDKIMPPGNGFVAIV